MASLRGEVASLQVQLSSLRSEVRDCTGRGRGRGGGGRGRGGGEEGGEEGGRDCSLRCVERPVVG